MKAESRSTYQIDSDLTIFFFEMDGICVVYSIRELIFQSFLRWSSYEKIETAFIVFLVEEALCFGCAE